jgi:16S rRNA (cytosine967-C5)-methyltransferase
MPRRGVAPRGDARGLAHEILVRVETTEAFADVLLADRLAGAGLASVDRALATQLVYGTLAWQGRLDHHLAGLVRMPLARLDPPVLAALRLGLYQLLFLDRVPAYAAVDASVRLARTAGRGAAGLVNAVLRHAATTGRAGLPLPERDADPIERLAIEWSHPRWLVARWAAEVGVEELPALLAANNVRGPTTIRANRPRITRDALQSELVAAGVEASPSRWAPEALTVNRGAERLRGLAAWRDGRFTFQGEASQLIAPLLALAPGARVLDACAAPGGKTCHAAELLDGGGLVVGLDRRTTGVGRLVAEAARLGAATVHAVVGDARQAPLRTRFDAVLVDAPCTGLGTLRRHPEVRWRRRPEDVARLAALQRAILTELAPLVRPGGVLVYAVCTLTHEETEAVVAEFCARVPRFVPEPAVEAPAETRTADGFLRTLPHRHDLDGFFAARLRARD